MYRACLFGAQISDISDQEKGRDSRQVRNLIIISVAFDVKNCYSGLFYSTGQHSRESALFSKTFRRQWTSLGHARSPCFLSVCYLPCITLTCSILGSVYLETTVNLQKYINQSCSMPENSFNLQKCSNHSCSILDSVYLKSTVNS